MSDFGTLVEHQIPHLRRYARALTHDRERADDLVQISLVRALAKEHLWQPGTNLRHWLFAILHNMHISDIRRSAREQSNIADLDPTTIMPARVDAASWAQLIDIDAAISGLPIEQRRVVLLVGLEGLSYEEAADALGLPVGTVRSRLSRARAALRARLELAEPLLDLAA